MPIDLTGTGSDLKSTDPQKKEIQALKATFTGVFSNKRMDNYYVENSRLLFDSILHTVGCISLWCLTRTVH